MDETPHTTTPPQLTVARLADLAGVSARTLHHYDAIGLLAPSARSDAGYRLYDAADLARLREILVWRRLDVPLAQIARLLDDPTVDRIAVLRHQRELVRDRLSQLDELTTALDQALEREAATTAPEEATTMTTDQQIIDALDGFDPADHDAEARERWGDTEAYRESARRTKEYGPDDWRRIKAEADANFAAMVATFEAGADASSDEAVAHAEAFRAHVSRWFYDMPPAMLPALGDMYAADPRFRATYEGTDGERPGMAEWVRDAWHARAARE